MLRDGDVAPGSEAALAAPSIWDTTPALVANAAQNMHMLTSLFSGSHNNDEKRLALSNEAN